LDRGEAVAATRALPANLNETDAHEAPILERLQYRTAQIGKAAGADALRNPLTGSTSVHPVVSLFPAHANGMFGAKEAEDAGTLPQSIQTMPQSEADSRIAMAELEQRLAEEKFAASQAVAAAVEQGRREARQVIEEEHAAERLQLQSKLVKTLEEFDTERKNYFHQVEGEVVGLALAIATRVLHREAQIDPLFLTGAVRIALDKLGDSSSVVMRVPPSDVALWKEFFRSSGKSRTQPGVLEDPSLAQGECVLVTQLGTIELGVRAQLEEIEKGFFDLLDRRPTGIRVSSATGARSSA
jgi:flagellar assembly protein FliH